MHLAVSKSVNAFKKKSGLANSFRQTQISVTSDHELNLGPILSGNVLFTYNADEAINQFRMNSCGSYFFNKNNGHHRKGQKQLIKDSHISALHPGRRLQYSSVRQRPELIF